MGQVTTQELYELLGELNKRTGKQFNVQHRETLSGKSWVIISEGFCTVQQVNTRQELKNALASMVGLAMFLDVPALQEKIRAGQAKLAQSDDKLSLATRRLRLFCDRARDIITATDSDIFTDAPECQEAVEDVAKASSNLWAIVQSMPAYIREPQESEVQVVEEKAAHA